MNDTSSAIAPDTLLASSDSVSGLAMLGKTATALAVVIGVILLCAWLLRRLHGARPLPGQALRIMGSIAVGQRERVVIVAVDDTWLVLGVSSGQVSKLHHMPAPSTPTAPGEAPARGFAERLARAVRQAPGSTTPDRRP